MLAKQPKCCIVYSKTYAAKQWRNKCCKVWNLGLHMAHRRACNLKQVISNSVWILFSDSVETKISTLGRALEFQIGVSKAILFVGEFRGNWKARFAGKTSVESRFYIHISSKILNKHEMNFCMLFWLVYHRECNILFICQKIKFKASVPVW